MLGDKFLMKEVFTVVSSVVFDVGFVNWHPGY